MYILILQRIKTEIYILSDKFGIFCGNVQIKMKVAQIQ